MLRHSVSVCYALGMTNTSPSVGIVKKHNDGGTYREIAFAETRNRWGVAITEWTTYRNTIVYEVLRASDKDVMFRLGWYRTEAEARAAANKLWLRDR